MCPLGVSCDEHEWPAVLDSPCFGGLKTVRLDLRLRCLLWVEGGGDIWDLGTPPHPPSQGGMEGGQASQACPVGPPGRPKCQPSRGKCMGGLGMRPSWGD